MILIVDDDPSITASLSLLLKQNGHRSASAASPAEALAWLEHHDCDLVLQDMNYSRQTSGDEGLELLARVKAVHPRLPVVLMTAWGSIDLAVKGMKAGAADFVTKPWSNEQMLQTVGTTIGLAAKVAPGVDDAVPSREELDAAYDFGDLVGTDPRLLRVLHMAGRVAATDASVLITGESGTGKEMVADALHRNSHRRGGPFVKVNLGGIPATLFESEMFGHVKGAFTDARQDRRGRFEMAHGGTIFLDEIGDVDPSSQVKLLRVLQDRSFEVLGSSVRRVSDVRVVSATNRPLADLVARGEFREDLLYRLTLITLHLPPLRERQDDIPLLASRFLETVAEVYGREGLRFKADAMRWLKQQPWPGNVRQLRQWIERAALVSPVDELDGDALRSVADMDPRETERDVLPPVGSMTMDEIERAMIVKSMRHHGGNVSRVAEALGLSRAALYRRLDKYGIPA
jgi:two-component system NtrC family response regulator